MTFQGDGSCPVPLDSGICSNCERLVMQEVCLGLCSDKCKWSNVSLMRGEYCAIRVQPAEEESNLVMMIAIIAGGVLGLVGICGGLRLFCKARHDAKKARQKDLARKNAAADMRKA